jgi:hypothetical protein
LAHSEYKKRHDIFAKIIHMNLAVKFNLLKDTQPHYIYKPESCLENDNYKLYFDRTVLTDIHIQHNRPDIIILNKQQKQAYLLDIAVPNSHNITQTYNTKINKYIIIIKHKKVKMWRRDAGNYVDKHCTTAAGWRWDTKRRCSHCSHSQ